MRIGTCIQCKDYKRLPDKGKCSSCLEKDEDNVSNEWQLVFGFAGTTPKVVEDELSKEEAKTKANNMKYIYARKQC